METLHLAPDSLRLRLLHSDAIRAPYLPAMLTIHRDLSSYVVFMRRAQDGELELMNLPQSLFRPSRGRSTPIRSALKVAKLSEQPPELIDVLRQDCFFSINGFKRPRRTERNASALNAVWVDLDCHDLPWGEAVASICSLIAAESLPEPSIVVDSGRGAWLLWLLSDGSTLDLPPQAHPGACSQVTALNRRIAHLIRKHAPHLNPDFGSGDVSRLMRVPGSTNSKAAFRTHTRFIFNDHADGRRRYFTIDDLLRSVPQPSGNHAPPRHAAPPPSPSSRKSTVAVTDGSRWTTPAHRRLTNRRSGGNSGYLAVFGARRAELQRIEAARGGLRQGTRSMGLLAFALTLQRLGIAGSALHDELEPIAARCHPPLPTGAVERAVKSAARGYKVTNLTLAEWLRVTPDEADRLGLTQIRPDFQPKRPDAHVRKGQKEQMETRRRALADWAEEWKTTGTPPTSRIVGLLLQCGLTASPHTVRRDLASLGLRPDTRKRRATSHIEEKA